ncbi:NACHT domain-containing protein [Agromyces sp. NPDC058110]|uniref:NACHT domain-containing protein n=1 Tax=Agromyces sp. NPDC058110 TaxID=3346345 RepID=UPI0036DDBDFE
MSLTMILLPVGAAAIKVALRLTDPTAPNVADSIDDFTGVFSRISDEIRQRSLIRRAQDMADEVARRLAQELEAEYHGIDDRELLPAVAEVTSAVNSIFPISRNERAEVVASADPPAAIFRLIKSRWNISEWELQHGDRVSSLAHSILRDVCHTAAAIIRKHPDLGIDMLAMLAQRSEDLARVVDEVRESVASVPHRTARANAAAAQARTEEDHDEFTVEYLRSVVNRFDQLELYGLDLEWETVHYSLTTSYITLRMGDDTSSAHHSNLGRALSSKDLVYVRGPAGSGKTTILQWLAVGMARRTLPAGFGRIASQIPLMIRLRNFTDGPLPAPAELANLTATTTILKEPAGWLQSICRRRGVVLLIDGVDEFPDERRGDLLRWLREVTDALHPRAVVIAGRPSAQNASLAIAREYDSAILDIQPMSREEIRSFVLHWHTSHARKTPRIGTEAFRVADTLCGSREYRSLASTPLLCAALCALFHAKNGSLPGSRIAIYETLIRLLLAQRDEQRGIRVDAVDLDVDQRRFILEQLALFMLTNNLTEVDAGRAIAVVERALRSLPAAANASALLAAMVKRSGVIREPANGKVDFVHRAFLEFLAARAHVDLDTVESLAVRADDQNFADAAILAGGLSNVTQFRALIETVMAKWDSTLEPRAPAWLTRLAAGLLAVRRARASDGAQALVRVLEQSLPPESEEAVRAVVSAGESLFVPLVDAVLRNESNGGDAPLAGALIRSLGEYGGERAFAALKSIPADIRLVFRDDLLAIWTWFEIESFARELLVDLNPQEDVSAAVATSRVFPYLSLLSPRFQWVATLPFPDATLAADCENVPLDVLEIGHLDVLEDPIARQCGFLGGLRQPRRVILRKVPSFDPSELSALLGSLERIRIELLSGGEIVLTEVLKSATLTDLEISGGTIIRRTTDPSLMFVGQDRTLSLLDGVEVEPRTKVHASSVKLRNVDPQTVTAIATASLVELEVRSQSDGFDLGTLSSAVNLETLRLQNCRELDNLASLTLLPNLRVVEILGDCRVRDVDEFLEVRNAVETVVCDQDLAALVNDRGNRAALRDAEAYEDYAEEPDAFERRFVTLGTSPLNIDPIDLHDSEDDLDLADWTAWDAEPSEEDLKRIENRQP